MPKVITVYNAAESAFDYALTATRRAIRAGDIALAERWMKLSERHWKISELARLAYEQRRAEARREIEEEERADMEMAAAMARDA